MNDKNDFTQGNVFKKLICFMLPVLGALVLQAMYGAVDILVVGRFGTTAGISGVSTGSSVINLVVFVVTGFSVGVTVLMGRYLGEKRPERVGKIVGGAICFFAVLAAVVTVIMLVLAEPLARLMQAPEEAVELTIQYIRICGGGIVFIIAYNVISAVFRGIGDSRMPLLFVAIACVVNIGGDLLFVAVFHMDVAGAALATVMAQAVSVILSIVIIRRRKLPFTLTRADVRFNFEVRRFVKVGFPIALQESLTNLSFLALCAFVNRLGLEASSGYGVANKVVTFVMLIPSALMQSMASFVSQNVGARKEDRAKKALLAGTVFGASIGVFIAFAAYWRGDLLVAIFTRDPAVIQEGWAYLRGFALETVVTPLLFSLIGYYNGHSRTVFVLLQGLAQTFLVRLPVSYIMSVRPDANLMQIGVAAPAATIFGIAINLIYFVFFVRRLSREERLEHVE